mmetsp:Transcript_31259/g.66081  ORF Transcript_31259/g.66081 Transcript_31259/m.66081 type:complete len:240 (-) Transcript_31259:429-1148(-)
MRCGVIFGSFPLLFELAGDGVGSFWESNENFDPRGLRGKETVTFFGKDVVNEVRFESLVGARKHRMKGMGYMEILVFVRTQVDLEIRGNSTPSLICQCPCLLITNPTMHTSPSGIKPSNMLKSEILSQSLIHNFHRHAHKFPAFVANLSSFTTTVSDSVVISQIDIKHQLPLNCLEIGHCIFILGRMVEHRANVDFSGATFDDGRGEFHLRGKGLVADVDFIPRLRLDGHAEFSVGEEE